MAPDVFVIRFQPLKSFFLPCLNWMKGWAAILKMSFQNLSIIIKAAKVFTKNHQLSYHQHQIYHPVLNLWYGLYYKHITIANDASRVISEWGHNLERHSRVVNYDLRGVIYTHLWCLLYIYHLWWSLIGDCNMFIV
jgi:hypothetical protein